MKNLLLLLSISFLLQSCFTYREADINPSTMIIGEKYKITTNHKISKVILKSISDSSIVVIKNWKEQQIPFKEITNIRKRKFSVVKTIVLPPIVAATIVALFIISDPVEVRTGEIGF